MQFDLLSRNDIDIIACALFYYSDANREIAESLQVVGKESRNPSGLTVSSGHAYCVNRQEVASLLANRFLCSKDIAIDDGPAFAARRALEAQASLAAPALRGSGPCQGQIPPAAHNGVEGDLVSEGLPPCACGLCHDDISGAHVGDLVGTHLDIKA